MPHAWQAAASFAARAHQHQLRKDGRTPYVAHPVRVAMTVAFVFGCIDETVLAAALLHDTIEDTGTDYDDLEQAFGRDVAGIVAALTKNKALREPEREHEYDQRLAAAGWRAALIKLADCYDNLTDHSQPARFADMLEKCSRALAIARPHAGEHREIARAAEVLEKLMRERAASR